MHDLIFERQVQLGMIGYDQWAAEIGLDVEKFKESMAQHRNARRIEDDRKLAEALQATGTPTFFVNGRRFIGAQPFESFKIIVEDELSKADQLIKQGHPLDASFYEAMVRENKNIIGK